LKNDIVLTNINGGHFCSRFIYPSIVSVFIASLFFPSGFGRYLATTLSTKQQVNALFGNFTWLSDDLSVEQADRLSHWDVANTNLFVSLGIFMSANVRQFNQK
jgi:chloride channel 2